MDEKTCDCVLATMDPDSDFWTDDTAREVVDLLEEIFADFALAADETCEEALFDLGVEAADCTETELCLEVAADEKALVDLTVAIETALEIVLMDLEPDIDDDLAIERIDCTIDTEE